MCGDCSSDNYILLGNFGLEATGCECDAVSAAVAEQSLVL